MAYLQIVGCHFGGFGLRLSAIGCRLRRALVDLQSLPLPELAENLLRIGEFAPLFFDHLVRELHIAHLLEDKHVPEHLLVEQVEFGPCVAYYIFAIGVVLEILVTDVVSAYEAVVVALFPGELAAEVAYKGICARWLCSRCSERIFDAPVVWSMVMRQRYTSPTFGASFKNEA